MGIQTVNVQVLPDIRFARQLCIVLLISFAAPAYVFAEDNERSDSPFRGFRRPTCLESMAVLSLLVAGGGGYFIVDSIIDISRKNDRLRRSIAELKARIEETDLALEENNRGDPTRLYLGGTPKLVEEAKRRGLTFIGNGIALDITGVEAKLTEAERALLKDPQKNRVAIVQLFLGKLNGAGTSFSVPDDPAQLRLASSFLAGSGMDQGVCRHKSTVLSALLNHYGIAARLEAGHAFHDEPYAPEDKTPNHAWVLVPELGLVADPENQYLLLERDYLRKHVNLCWRAGGELRPKSNPGVAVPLHSRAEVVSWTSTNDREKSAREAIALVQSHEKSGRLVSIEFEYDSGFFPQTLTFVGSDHVINNGFYYPSRSPGAYRFADMRSLRITVAPASVRRD